MGGVARSHAQALREGASQRSVDLEADGRLVRRELLKGVAIATLLGVGSELSISGESDLVQAIR